MEVGMKPRKMHGTVVTEVIMTAMTTTTPRKVEKMMVMTITTLVEVMIAVAMTITMLEEVVIMVAMEGEVPIITALKVVEEAVATNPTHTQTTIVSVQMPFLGRVFVTQEG
jgi:hypothetical protein